MTNGGGNHGVADKPKNSAQKPDDKVKSDDSKAKTQDVPSDQ
jgi:hypothetical protein